MKKPEIGYKKRKKEKKKRHKTYVSSLVHKSSKDHKITISERVIKFLIWLALRMVIRPKKWKESVDKNFEIIDRTYKRIMSPDFIFIPSSIAFYIIMAFVPVLALVSFATITPGINTILSKEKVDNILGKFIPGISEVLKQLNDWSSSLSSADFLSVKFVGGGLTVFFSLLVTIWIGSAGMAKLVYTQSYIYQHKFTGGYWMNRFRGMFMIISLTIGLILVLMINIFVVEEIEHLTTNYSLKIFLKYLFLVIGLLLLIFIGMIILFKFSPRYKIKIRHVIPGAMVAALPSALFLSLFGLITTFWKYGNYGTIGVIMYIGMTSLTLTTFIFTGLIANAAYYRTFVGLTLRKKRTLSKK